MDLGFIQIGEKIIFLILFIPLFLVSIAIHEFAHAFIASRLGDNTAKNMGRLSLNPIKHADLVGSLIVPLATFISGFAMIGWAKPVPIDRRNFKNTFRDDALVSFAGPLSNLLLAIVFLLLFVLLGAFNLLNNNFVLRVFWYGMFLNIFLFAFNLLPIPPLDGSHILYDVFPNKITAKLLNLGLYGSIILLVFIYSPLWGFFIDFVNLIMNFFLSLAGYGYV
ncbi:MAG: site-2 protease family protein [Ignavibacteriaceae bacterium]|nr:site-2 protease family protein [Ignavibacteriaceae bacterium]